MEIHWGLVAVQEHQEWTLICDVEIATFNAIENQCARRGSCDWPALLEIHRGLMSVQEHREETLVFDADVAESNTTKNQTTLKGSSDQMACF